MSTSENVETILITGAAGWLGSMLAIKLAEEEHKETALGLILADIVEPKAPDGVKCLTVKVDLTSQDELDKLFATSFGPPTVIYAMHGMMSLGSEENWDMGMKVNLDSTRALLDKARHSAGDRGPITFVLSSSVATYGGNLPEVVLPSTACTPQGAYGTAKLICEYLVSEYTRKGYVRGIALKLPTIVVRPGPPARATSAFVSALAREPLQGQVAVCPIGASAQDPVLETTRLWLASPGTTLRNLAHAKRVAISGKMVPYTASVALPGFTASIADILQSLRDVAGDSTLDFIKFEHDEICQRIVTSWPHTFDTSYAFSLGFEADAHGYTGCIQEFRQNYLSSK